MVSLIIRVGIVVLTGDAASCESVANPCAAEKFLPILSFVGIRAFVNSLGRKHWPRFDGWRASSGLTGSPGYLPPGSHWIMLAR